MSCRLNGFQRGALLTAVVLLPLVLPAEETVMTVQRAKNPASKSKAEVHGYLKFESMKYPTDIPDNAKLSNGNQISTNLRFNYRGEKNRFVSDINLGKTMEWGGAYFSVQEIYWSKSGMNDQVQFSIGRKLESWSQIDSDWQLGLWEPKFNLDGLRPVNQGLTGFFYKQRNGRWETLAYLTPIFIPTMGPEVKERDGAITSESRWFRSPARTADVFGRETQVVYSINVPDILKLISKPGIGMRVKWGGDDLGFWASANAARKPINSLLLKYDYSLAATTASTKGEVVVGPSVSYHSLVGADVGYFFENGMISASMLLEEPSKDVPSYEEGKDWIQQQPGRIRVYGAHAETNISMPFMEDPVGVALDYLKTNEESTRDIDTKGEDRGALFDHRLNFSNALSIKSTIATRLFQKRFISQIKYMREFEQRGTIVGTEFNYYPSAQWAVVLGVDMLAPDDTGNENTDNHFINQFRANDRVYGGLNYVF